MKCAIMQPHFFPWPGYFNLIFKSNLFVFLDDAQYSKASWHSKNYIISNKNKKIINVPTLKSQLSTKIKNKQIVENEKWKLKLIQTISQSYSKHKFFKDISELLNYFSKIKTNNLSELNILLIKFIAMKLNIKSNFFYSSDFNLNEKRTFKLVKILEELKAKEYISPKNAQKYLEEDKFQELTEIKLTFNDFNSKEYNQINDIEFIEKLSIIDLIANIGWHDSEIYIKKE